MRASGWQKIGSISVVFACGCGGRAAEGSPQRTGVAGSVTEVPDSAGVESADASAEASALPDWPDAGARAYCSPSSHSECAFTADDRPDLPPEQRWGWLAQWANFACPVDATCGNVTFAVDHDGCVTPAAVNAQSKFSDCVLGYVQQFSWPCAADQQVQYFVSCTLK
jgi:hypothetical protein